MLNVESHINSRKASSLTNANTLSESHSFEKGFLRQASLTSGISGNHQSQQFSDLMRGFNFTSNRGSELSRMRSQAHTAQAREQSEKLQTSARSTHATPASREASRREEELSRIDKEQERAIEKANAARRERSEALADRLARIEEWQAQLTELSSSHLGSASTEGQGHPLENSSSEESQSFQKWLNEGKIIWNEINALSQSLLVGGENSQHQVSLHANGAGNGGLTWGESGHTGQSLLASRLASSLEQLHAGDKGALGQSAPGQRLHHGQTGEFFQHLSSSQHSGSLQETQNPQQQAILTFSEQAIQFLEAAERAYQKEGVGGQAFQRDLAGLVKFLNEGPFSPSAQQGWAQGVIGRLDHESLRSDRGLANQASRGSTSTPSSAAPSLVATQQAHAHSSQGNLLGSHSHGTNGANTSANTQNNLFTPSGQWNASVSSPQAFHSAAFQGEVSLPGRGDVFNHFLPSRLNGANGTLGRGSHLNSLLGGQDSLGTLTNPLAGTSTQSATSLQGSTPPGGIGGGGLPAQAAFLSKLVGGVRSHAAGGREVFSLTLTPAHLGEVSVLMKRSAGEVAVRLTVSNNAAKKVVEEQISDLRIQFEQADVQVDSLEVLMDNEQATSSSGGFAHHHSSQASMTDMADPAPTQATEPPALKASYKENALEDVDGLFGNHQKFFIVGEQPQLSLVV